jgi:antitoxin CptB
MAPEMLERYEALLCENDQDLYPWMTGAVPAPAAHAGLIAEISDFLRSHRAAAR